MDSSLSGLMLVCSLSACSQFVSETAVPQVFSERIVEVSAENPRIEDLRGGTIGVDGIPDQETVTLKMVETRRSDERVAITFENVPSSPGTSK